MSGGIGQGCIGKCKYQYLPGDDGFYNWVRQDPTNFKCGPDPDCVCYPPNMSSLSIAQSGNIVYTDCRIKPAPQQDCSGACGWKCVADGHGGYMWVKINGGCFGNPAPYDLCSCTPPNIIPGSGAANSGVTCSTQCSAINLS